MKDLKILYYFIIVIFFINNTYSVDVPSDEYTCLSNFFTKFNLSINYPKDSTTGLYSSLCGSTSYIKCFTNGSVQYFQGIGLNEVIPNNVEVLIEDLQCLPFNTQIYISGSFKISQEFLYYKFDYVTSVTLSNVIINTLDQKLPPYLTYSIYSTNLDGQTIKLSNLINVQSFSSSSKLLLEVDTVGIESSNLNTLSLTLSNLPNFNGFTLESLLISFTSTFNIQDLENFKYIKAISVYFNFYSVQSVPWYLGDNTFITTFEHRGVFDVPTAKYSLELNQNYKSLTIKDTGTSLFFNNEIAFQVSNQTNLYYQASLLLDSSINSLVPSSNYIGKYKTSQIRYSYLSGDLPSYNGSALALDFSNNKITGTLDSSWCSTNLFISSNKLTGTVPSCFSCYFKYTPDQSTYKTLSDPGTIISFTKMIDRFKNNSFTNLNESLPCTTFRPQVSLINSTTIAIRGDDIGFDINNFKINSTIACAYTPDAIRKLSFEFYCNISPKNFIDQTSTIVKFTLPVSVSYQFSLVESNPIFTQIQAKSGLLTLLGSFFSSYKGQSNQKLYLGKNLLAIDTTGFSFITAIINSSNYYSDEKQLLIIQNGDKMTKIRVYVKEGYNNYQNFKCPNACVGNENGTVCDFTNGKCSSVICPNDCYGNGKCNTDLYGQCECFNGFLGDDCSKIQCSDPNCSGNGQCNTTIGECECNNGYLGEICNEFQCLDPKCSGNGQCNTAIGQCECFDGFLGNGCSQIQCSDPTCSNGNGQCDINIGECICGPIWAGENCEISAHYITSIEPSTIYGGNSNFYGSFGTVNQGIKLFIDSDKECNITLISSSKVSCLAPPGKGIHNITIIQNGITFIGLNIYKYIDQSLTNGNNQSSSNENNNCIYSNNCGDLGQENTNNNNNEKPVTQVKVNNNTAEVELNSDVSNKTKFKIHIKSLSEVNLYGQVIKYYPLNDSWTINTKDSNVYTFNKVLKDNQECLISTQIEIITQDKQLSFADVNFNIEKGSIKFTLSIENYRYESFLNTLQLEFESNSLENSNETIDCNTNGTKINTDYYSDQNDLSIIKITQNNIDFNARFINKAISDSRPTYLSSKIINSNINGSVNVILSLPHFINSLVIDPDFSVLLSSSFKSSCNQKSSKKFVIPLSVVLSCVGVGTIVSLSYYFYKRNKDSIFREKIMKLSELSNKLNK